MDKDFIGVLRRSKKTTPGGAVVHSEVVAWQRIGDAVWLVRRQRNAGVVFWVGIELHVLVGPKNIKHYIEDKNLVRADCPLEYFKLASDVKNRNWRDSVWRWHEEQFTKSLEK